MSVLYLIGFIQALFVSSLILLKKGKRLADYVLAFYILVMGFFLIFIYAGQTGYYLENPLIVTLDILYWVWIGPALYLYIDLITSDANRFKVIHLIHLIPTLIVFAGFGGYFLDDSVVYFEAYQSDSWLFNMATYVWYYNSPIYYLICIFKLRHHKLRVKTYYSTTRDVDLKWLSYLVHGFAAFLIMGLLLGLLYTYFSIELPFGSMHYTWLVMVVYIFGMGYFGFFQRGVFFDTAASVYAAGLTDQKTGGEFEPRQQILKTAYLKSGLGEEESGDIVKRLTSVMENKKPYIQFELNLRDLAEIVQTTPHKLSQVINERLQCNFFEFVNNYRLEAVKIALAKPENDDYTILAIAYDCGFSSKSAFYTIFKKKTGMTPSAYRAYLHSKQMAS